MILPLIPIFLMALNNNIIKEDLTVHPIDQSLYSNAESFYRADNVDLGNFYKSSVEDAKGVATAVTGESLSKGNLSNYSKFELIITLRNIKNFLQAY